MNQPSGEGVTLKPISRNEMAQKIAAYIVEGTYVNLGIGMPTLVANYLPPDKEIFLHSENGILGMGPAPQDADIDWDLINAGKQPVTLLTGGSYFHQADSFAMMRGGHIDISVLGGFQVSQTGDLANWHTGEVDAVPAVGGAMDLAVGAKKTYVMMEHLTKDGKSKLVAQCTYPLTGIGCVSMVFTDLGIFEILPEGFFVSLDAGEGAAAGSERGEGERGVGGEVGGGEVEHPLVVDGGVSGRCGGCRAGIGSDQVLAEGIWSRLAPCAQGCGGFRQAKGAHAGPLVGLAAGGQRPHAQQLGLLGDFHQAVDFLALEPQSPGLAHPRQHHHIKQLIDGIGEIEAVEDLATG